MPTDPNDLNLHEQSRTEIIDLDPKTSRTVVFQHEIGSSEQSWSSSPRTRPRAASEL